MSQKDPPDSSRTESTPTLRALVIDDDEIASELLVSLLREANWNVYWMPSPIGATKFIVDKQIDVVVLDVMMPDITGDKLARLLRGNSRLSKVGVVLVSGSSAELERLRQSPHIDAVVHKGDARRDLVSHVQQAYRARAGA